MSPRFPIAITHIRIVGTDYNGCKSPNVASNVPPVRGDILLLLYLTDFNKTGKTVCYRRRIGLFKLNV